MFAAVAQRALGIDPGLVRTGWAVLEPVGLRAHVLGHGVIAPPTDESLPSRLAHGAQRLREVLGEFEPTFVALEEIFTAPRHPRSALLMAHMRGAICLVLEEAGVPIVSMTATTVKQRLTSSGHASKEQVQRMVQRLTGLDPAVRMRLDETDAMALALAALYQRTHPFARLGMPTPAGTQFIRAEDTREPPSSPPPRGSSGRRKGAQA
jgi:crossover junction endodeoxyribonuclease RuvC